MLLFYTRRTLQDQLKGHYDIARLERETNDSLS